MKGLVLGSCRVLYPMSCSKRAEDLVNVPKKRWIGRHHSARQIAEIVESLAGDTEITSGTFACGAEARVFRAVQKMENIRKSFKDVSFLVVEVCSLKTPLSGTKTLHFQHPEATQKCSVETQEELVANIQRILKAVGSDRRVLFVSHFMHARIANRERIWSALNQCCAGVANAAVCRPSDLWNAKSRLQFLKPDEIHYRRDDGKRVWHSVAAFIDEKLDDLLR
nr:hypothetical protein TetV2_00225 [Oceanusvirus sp.]